MSAANGTTLNRMVGIFGRIVTGFNQRAVFVGTERWRLGFWYRLDRYGLRPFWFWGLPCESGRAYRLWRFALTIRKANTSASGPAPASGAGYAGRTGSGGHDQ